MANTKVILKKSGSTGNTPNTLEYGELAINYADGVLFYKTSNGTISTISTGSEGSASSNAALQQVTFTGDGSTVNFNLGTTTTSDSYVVASINGLIQDPSTYSVDRNILTFSTAPADGDNIDLRTFYSYSAVIISNYANLSNTSSNQTIDSYNKLEYRTVKYLIQAVQGSNVHCTEVVLTHNDTDVFKNEYGTMWTNSILMDVSAYIDSTNVYLVVTPNYTDTKIDFTKTSLAARTLT